MNRHRRRPALRDRGRRGADLHPGRAWCSAPRCWAWTSARSSRPAVAAIRGGLNRYKVLFFRDQ